MFMFIYAFLLSFLLSLIFSWLIRGVVLAVLDVMEALGVLGVSIAGSIFLSLIATVS